MIYADEFSCTLLQPHVLYTSSFDWLIITIIIIIIIIKTIIITTFIYTAQNSNLQFPNAPYNKRTVYYKYIKYNNI